MINYLKEYQNLLSVMVNHGSNNTKSMLARRINHALNVKSSNIGILGRKLYYRIRTRRDDTKFSHEINVK